MSILLKYLLKRWLIVVLLGVLCCGLILYIASLFPAPDEALHTEEISLDWIFPIEVVLLSCTATIFLNLFAQVRNNITTRWLSFFLFPLLYLILEVNPISWSLFNLTVLFIPIILPFFVLQIIAYRKFNRFCERTDVAQAVAIHISNAAKYLMKHWLLLLLVSAGVNFTIVWVWFLVNKNFDYVRRVLYLNVSPAFTLSLAALGLLLNTFKEVRNRINLRILTFFLLQLGLFIALCLEDIESVVELLPMIAVTVLPFFLCLTFFFIQFSIQNPRKKFSS